MSIEFLSSFFSITFSAHLKVHLFLNRRKCIHARFAINIRLIGRQKHDTQRCQPFHTLFNVHKCQCFFNKLTANGWSIARLGNEI